MSAAEVASTRQAADSGNRWLTLCCHCVSPWITWSTDWTRRPVHISGRFGKNWQYSGCHCDRTTNYWHWTPLTVVQVKLAVALPLLPMQSDPETHPAFNHDFRHCWRSGSIKDVSQIITDVEGRLASTMKKPTNRHRPNTGSGRHLNQNANCWLRRQSALLNLNENITGISDLSTPIKKTQRWR